MALNISLLLVPWPIFLLALILIVAVIIVLTLLDKRLHRNFIIKKEEEDTYYIRKLRNASNLKNQPEQFLTALDDIAREFFEEEFQITGLKYSDLIEKFKERKDGGAMKFCEVMQETLYSGEKLSNEKLKFLFDKLLFLVREQEKERLRTLTPTQEQVSLQDTKTILEKPKAQPPKQENVQQKEIVKTAELAEATPNMNIVSYLTEGERRGFEIDFLKQKLLESGFDESDVNVAINYLKKKNVEQQVMMKEKPVQSSIKPLRPIDETKGRTILARFLHPKEKEIETIKKEVEDKEGKEEEKTRVINVVPHKKEEIAVKLNKVYPREEPESHKQIGSMDDLERLKEKIKEKKQELSFGGYRGAKLGED